MKGNKLLLTFLELFLRYLRKYYSFEIGLLLITLKKWHVKFIQRTQVHSELNTEESKEPKLLVVPYCVTFSSLIL